MWAAYVAEQVNKNDVDAWELIAGAYSGAIRAPRYHCGVVSFPD